MSLISTLFSLIAAAEPPVTLEDTALFETSFGYEDDTSLPEIGQYVLNTASGETGLVRGIWTNIGGQTVVNVRVNGIAASWNLAIVQSLTMKVSA